VTLFRTEENAVKIKIFLLEDKEIKPCCLLGEFKLEDGRCARSWCPG
jgi:hypothetical protein